MNTADQDRIIIALSGPSSSGKSTVAKALHSLLANSVVIHLDDFYFPDADIPYNDSVKEKNWDCPDAIDFKKFKSYILSIKDGGEFQQIESLEIDSDLKLADDELKELKSQIENHRELTKYQIVLVDGFMLFHEKDIIDLFDIKLFFYASHDTLNARRKARKGYNTVAGFWVDPPNYFEKIVWPEYEKNHKHLFEGEDVNSSLTSHAKQVYKISDYKNDNSIPIKEVVNWSVNKIFEYFRT